MRSIELRETLVREHPEVGLHRYGLAWSLNRLAAIELRIDQPEAARAALVQAAKQMSQLLRVNPGHIEYENFRGWVQFRLGEALERLGRDQEATAAYRDALAAQRFAFGKAPQRFGGDIAEHYLKLLVVLAKLGRHAEAANLLREARADLRGAAGTA